MGLVERFSRRGIERAAKELLDSGEHLTNAVVCRLSTPGADGARVALALTNCDALAFTIEGQDHFGFKSPLASVLFLEVDTALRGERVKYPIEASLTFDVSPSAKYRAVDGRRAEVIDGTQLMDLSEQWWALCEDSKTRDFLHALASRLRELGRSVEVHPDSTYM